MAIHLRERPHTSAGGPSFARLGWSVAAIAACLVGLGGGARLLMEPSGPPSRAAEYAARKKPAKTAANAPAPMDAGETGGRSVRVIPTDLAPVGSIARGEPSPVVVRPSRGAFGEIQRASGASYQGFKVVAGR